MLGNNLAIGTKLNVNFKRDAKEQYIISFVYDYYEDNGLFIPVTIRDIAEYRFIAGEAIFIVITTGSGLLRWEGELKGITKIRGKLMLCVVLHNINPEVINRREAYRVSCEESIKLNVEGKEYTATLRDVSFLGAGFDCKDSLEIGSVVDFKLKDNSGVLSVIGTIVRRKEAPKSEGFNYGIRLDERKSSDISRFVVAKQMEEINIRRTKKGYYSY